MDDEGREIKEDQGGVWLGLASLAVQLHCVHTNIPIINNLIINYIFPNDHLSHIIYFQL